MKSAAFALLFSLSASSCRSNYDDADEEAGVENADAEMAMDAGDMPQECAEDEQRLYPGGCPPFDDPRPTVSGCYMRCEASDCPSGLSCVEVWHNPCADGMCQNCSELVWVCD